MNLTYQEQARFDVVVAHIRNALSYPFEGLLMAPPGWADQAVLYSTNKQLIVRAGSEDEVVLNCPYLKVDLSEFIVVAEDADYPLSEAEYEVFVGAVRAANDRFVRLLEGGPWKNRIARLIVEVELLSPATDIDSIRRRILAPLCDVLDAIPILPPLPQELGFDSSNAINQEYHQKLSFFLPAEIQLHEPLEERKGIELIRKILPPCPARIVSGKFRFANSSPIEHSMSFRVRQF